MNEKAILEHNEKVCEKILQIEGLMDALDDQLYHLEESVKAPCEFCNYDGFYRCGVCKDFRYFLFNIEDWENYLKELTQGRL